MGVQHTENCLIRHWQSEIQCTHGLLMVELYEVVEMSDDDQLDAMLSNLNIY